MTSKPKPFLTITEVADRYGVHRNTVTNWMKSGRLRGQKLGRVVRVSADELRRFEALEFRDTALGAWD